MKLLERDVFCAECGELIDYERCHAAHAGFDDLFVLAEAVEDHRQETGCPADGEWRTSEWREL